MLCDHFIMIQYSNSLTGVITILLLAKSSTSYNVVVTSYNEVCAYNDVIEPYIQIDAAYKETLKHTIISHNIMKWSHNIVYI